MTTLDRLAQAIFDVEGVRPLLSGQAPSGVAYWKTSFDGDATVAAFKLRFARRFPNVEVELLDGVGNFAHGNRLMKNLRATYDYAWIENEYSETVLALDQILKDQKKQIAALRKALRQTAQAAEPEEEMFDAYAALGVKPDASDEEIRHAFKKRMQVFHPDRFANVDPLLVELVSAKAQEINRARDEIARQRAQPEAA